ncbi:MAG: gamma-glutamyltransferase [Phycisphaerales bacterium]|nr:gamma-glutamyltransferase [Phycisphaerales bacterium]
MVALVVGLVLVGCRSFEPVPPVPTQFAHAAVAADHPIASEAGAAMLRQGGNAVDAAVATSFCLSVVRPYSCGIGGGGFMLIHRPGVDGETVAINYRETAPGVVDPDFYERMADPAASRYGANAVGVPGTVAGLLLALERYGTLDRATVMAPAIRVAEEGFDADPHFVRVVQKLGTRRRDHPEHTQAAGFIWDQLCHRGALAVGDRIRNPAQAKALRLIRDQGESAFYSGPIAAALVETMRRRGGVITHEDLARYEPVVMTPLRGRYGPYEIVGMPPPSSGGVAMLQVLGLLERLAVVPGNDDRPEDPHDPAYMHLLVEALKHAFADRAEYLADAAFVPVPVSRLLSEAYLDDRASVIRPDRTAATYDYGSVEPAPDDAGTSHISVVDAAGMAVACTESINLEFGALVSVDTFGFALNNEMDDFATIRNAPNAFGLRQSDRNLPEPGKRPLSSMSPTIVLEDDRVVLVAGGSGGPRIITGTLQCILNCLLFERPPLEAVALPRVHHQWMPEVLEFERRWDDEEAVAAMERLGHATTRSIRESIVQLVEADAQGVRPASDPRKGGRPAGY